MYIKIHHCPFQCLLHANGGEVFKAALYRRMPHHKGDRKASTMELEESGTKDKAERTSVFEILLNFSNLSLSLLSSFDAAF